MKINKLIFASSLSLIVASGSMAHAQVVSQPWQARSVEDVLAALETTDDHELKYTIQYGDTLSVISEAMNIDANKLAEINDIYNIDLIYPETVLYASYDNQARAHSVTVETTEGDQYETALPVNLSVAQASWTGESEENQLQASLAVEELETESVEVAEAKPARVEVAEATSAPVEEVETEQVTENPVVAATPAPEKKEEAVASSIYTFKYVEAKPAATKPAANKPAETVVEAAETVEEPVVEQTIEIVLDEPEEVLENVVENRIVEVAPTPEVAEEIKEEIPVEAIEEDIEADLPSQEIVEDAFKEATPEIYQEETVEVEVVEETIEVVPASPEESYEVVETTQVEQPVVNALDNPQNRGLQANVAEFKEEVAAQYDVQDFSLYRPGDWGDHGSGKAVDFMVYNDTAKGDAIADYSVQQMQSGQEDISYVIWKQQINGDWTNYQWQLMEDRGSITANHYDHVHVSFN